MVKEVWEWRESWRHGSGAERRARAQSRVTGPARGTRGARAGAEQGRAECTSGRGARVGRKDRAGNAMATTRTINCKNYTFYIYCTRPNLLPHSNLPVQPKFHLLSPCLLHNRSFLPSITHTLFTLPTPIQHSPPFLLHLQLPHPNSLFQPPSPPIPPFTTPPALPSD